MIYYIACDQLLSLVAFINPCEKYLKQLFVHLLEGSFSNQIVFKVESIETQLHVKSRHTANLGMDCSLTSDY